MLQIRGVNWSKSVHSALMLVAFMLCPGTELYIAVTIVGLSWGLRGEWADSRGSTPLQFAMYCDWDSGLGRHYREVIPVSVTEMGMRPSGHFVSLPTPCWELPVLQLCSVVMVPLWTKQNPKCSFSASQLDKQYIFICKHTMMLTSEYFDWYTASSLLSGCRSQVEY